MTGVDKALGAWSRAVAARNALNTAATAAVNASKLDGAGQLVKDILALGPQYQAAAVIAGDLSRVSGDFGVGYSSHASDLFKTSTQLQGQCYNLGGLLADQAGVTNPVVDPKLGTPPPLFAGLGSGVVGSITTLAFVGVAGLLAWRFLR